MGNHHTKTDLKQRNASDVPPKILSKLSKFLSPKKKKAKKLVSKSQLETCNLLPSQDEVLDCVAIYKLADTHEFLSKSETSVLNLEFDFVNFLDDPSFWQNNGSRIQSLTFNDCQFSGGIDEILISCHNLVGLTFIYTSVLPPNGQGRRHNLRLFNNFERFSRNGIVCENLNSLKIHIGVLTKITLSDQMMYQLLTIFPKLKILKIIYPEFFQYKLGKLDDLKPDYSDPSKISDTEFTFSPVLNYLMTYKDQIEKLKLYFFKSFPEIPRSPDSARRILDVLTTMSRLTKLSINLGHSQQLGVVERFLSSKSLKSFGLERWNLVPVTLDSLILSNPQLEHLKIWGSCGSDPSSIATKPLLEALMSSGLKSCKMFIRNSILVDDADSLQPEFSVQMGPSTLPELSVDILRSGPWERRVEMVQFLRYAQNILHLRLDNGSAEELQALLKYQKKLRSLIMNEQEDYQMSFPEDCIDAFKNSFYHLTELEHLEFGYAMANLFLSSVSPGSTILKNLKYLRINHLQYEDNVLISPSDLLRLADVSPNLVGLYIDYGQPVPVDILTKLCSKLNRLQFLRWDVHKISDDDIYSDEDYRKIFSICPSLRVLCRCMLLYSPNSSRSDVYFFDTIKQEVVPILNHVPYLTLRDVRYFDLDRLRNRNILYTFAEPRIARYTVDWLRF